MEDEHSQLCFWKLRWFPAQQWRLCRYTFLPVNSAACLHWLLEVWSVGIFKEIHSLWRALFFPTGTSLFNVYMSYFQGILDYAAIPVGLSKIYMEKHNFPCSCCLPLTLFGRSLVTPSLWISLQVHKSFFFHNVAPSLSKNILIYNILI